MTTKTGSPRQYPPGEHPALPPPTESVGIIGWLRTNLFSSLSNTALTIVTLWLLWLLISSLAEWMIFNAVIRADSQAACRAIDGGACWAVIAARFDQFVYGFYPETERSRPNLAFVLLFIALAPILYDRVPARRSLLWFSAIYPFLGGWLTYGGLGLPVVPTGQYGGFLLTLIIGITGIAASLPLGIALALGRQSKMIAFRVLCTLFIEFARGVPLITLSLIHI